ncbi:MAG: hypothetical protein AB7H88_21735 [Vicinamibacterales bacterium]
MLTAVFAAFVFLSGVITGDWIGSAAAAVLVAGWFLLRVEEGPPVLFFAFAFQWVQVSIGIFYVALTGRTLTAIEASDYRPMVLIGLGCLLALAAGVRLGIRFIEARYPTRPIDVEIFSMQTLVVAYAVAAAAAGVVQQLAWQYPVFTQAILAVSYLRLGLVFLLLRRLTRPSPHLIRIGMLLGVEVVLGLTGYFASFREPMILAAIALSEVFDRHRASHWISAVAVTMAITTLGMLWIGVRQEFRQDFFDVDMFAESRSMRLERMNTLTTEWVKRDKQEFLWDLDFLVDRIWAIYYPALAVQRVPRVLPHTNGAIIGSALRHIVTPRVLFPNKAPLPSDSEMVRLYSGVYVAGAEEDTSIAFGYAAETYVDFGVPLMFGPVLLWGIFLGAAYQTLLVVIRHRELAVPLVTVIFWLSLFLFERSWIKWMGLTGTLLIYLGGVTWLLDRWLMQRFTVEVAPPQLAPSTLRPASREAP